MTYALDLPEGAIGGHNSDMKSKGIQISLTAMLILVACAAGNFWLFRQGVLWGILGLSVSKHVLTAYLCQQLGVNAPRQTGGASEGSGSLQP